LATRKQIQELEAEQPSEELDLDIKVARAELALDEKLLMQLVERRHEMRWEMRFGGPHVQMLRPASP
jgi:hypothetical protein